MDADQLYRIGMVVLAVTAVTTFPSLFFISAPYGRHRRAGWGPEMDARLSWIVQELPAPTVFAVVFLTGETAFQLVPLMLFGLWEAHYVQRTFVYPFLLRIQGKRNPVATVLMAIIFNVINGYVNAFALTHLGRVYPTGWLADPRFVVGLLLFAAGYIVNRHADHILLHLRQPGETGYKIPQGGLYPWISAPNYFGEIIQWCGWALCTWTLAGALFAVFTAANLMPRAWTNHRWYREKFPDYPPERRAIIPFVW
jgi:3-oxo-5-alpha-steroid 4-dehydrogenase 1